MTDPSTAVAFAMSTSRGKRSGVLLKQKGVVSNKFGLEDVNEYFDAAKSPPLQQHDANGKQQQQPEQPKKKKVVKRTPRFSLPNAKDGEAKQQQARDVSAFREKLDKAKALSPSDLSRVSTAPPTPQQQEQQQEQEHAVPSDDDFPIGGNDNDDFPNSPEEARASPEEEETQSDLLLLKHKRRSQSPVASPLAQTETDFPDHDLSDDDDLIPPPPPEEVYSEPEEDKDATENNNHAVSPGVVDLPDKVQEDYDNDNDDDDDDGFLEGTHDLRTPESAEASLEKPKPNKKEKRKPAPRKAKTSKRKGPFSSPPGYQVADRDFQVVPVSDYKVSPEKGVRRSRRARFPPLEFWKNEQPVYEAHNEHGDLGDAMGNMPVVSGILTALPTPYKKRKVTRTTTAAKQGRPRSKKTNHEIEEIQQTPFDDRKLRKKYKYMDSDTATLWDEVQDAECDMKVVAFGDTLKRTKLPLSRNRFKGDSKIVGEAGQAFNIPTDDNQIYMGYIMGQLLLPPKAIKDHEGVGECSQTFTVCTGQPNAIELAYSDPYDGEGDFDPDTAIRYLLSPGDLFRVPPGNSYRIQNHSKTTEALLSWTIIRPRVRT